jgi:ribosomal protein L23
VKSLSLFGRDFEKLLVEAVDDGLSTLGDSAKQAIYYHLEKSFNVKKEDIPSRITAFTQAIENIFGVGADFVEILIMKKLYEKVDESFKWNESEGFGFAQYVSQAKRAFQEKNMIKTVKELIECDEEPIREV